MMAVYSSASSYVVCELVSAPCGASGWHGACPYIGRLHGESAVSEFADRELWPFFSVGTEKENVDCLLRLRYSRYRQTPLHHIRVKAHADWREHPCFYSWCKSQFWRISNNQILKRTLLILCMSKVWGLTSWAIVF